MVKLLVRVIAFMTLLAGLLVCGAQLNATPYCVQQGDQCTDPEGMCAATGRTCTDTNQDCPFPYTGCNPDCYCVEVQ